MSIEEEILGADYWMHGIKHDYYDYDSVIPFMRKEWPEVAKKVDEVNKTPTSTEFNRDLIERYWGKIKDTKEAENILKRFTQNKSWIPRMSIFPTLEGGEGGQKREENVRRLADNWLRAPGKNKKEKRKASTHTYNTGW